MKGVKSNSNDPIVIEDSQEEDSEEEFIVEKILYYYNNKYLVKWKGFSMDENTWEPIENFCEYSIERIKEYKSICMAITKRITRTDVAPILQLERIEKKVKNSEGKEFFICKWRGFPGILNTAEPVDYVRRYYSSVYREFTSKKRKRILELVNGNIEKKRKLNEDNRTKQFPFAGNLLSEIGLTGKSGFAPPKEFKESQNEFFRNIQKRKDLGRI